MKTELQPIDCTANPGAVIGYVVREHLCNLKYHYFVDSVLLLGKMRQVVVVNVHIVILKHNNTRVLQNKLSQSL